MIFGVSLAINIDEENVKWTKTGRLKSAVRIFIGFIGVLGIEWSLGYFNLIFQ